MKTEIPSAWRASACVIAGLGAVALAYSIPLGLASVGAGLLMFAVPPNEWARPMDSIQSVTTPVRLERPRDVVIARCGIAALLAAAFIAMLQRG